jgi:hypothetical protein
MHSIDLFVRFICSLEMIGRYFVLTCLASLIEHIPWKKVTDDSSLGILRQHPSFSMLINNLEFDKRIVNKYENVTFSTDMI